VSKASFGHFATPTLKLFAAIASQTPTIVVDRSLIAVWFIFPVATLVSFSSLLKNSDRLPY